MFPTIKRVLLCKPTYFAVDFVINPHMKLGSVDTGRAMLQWNNLVTALTGSGIKADIIKQEKGLPDMVFATDQGIVQNDAIVLANFRFDERKKETTYYREWFISHGFKIKTIDKELAFEGGGNTQFFGDILFVGIGFRATAKSCDALSEQLSVKVLPLEIIDPYYYHLDTCYVTIDNDSAFYYPPAFSEQSCDLLKSVVRNLYKLTKTEAEGFAANSFVSGNTIFIQANLPSFKAKLEALGKKVIEVDVSEFHKAGGGIHCLINPLEKKYD